jgi:hypothetical protein
MSFIGAKKSFIGAKKKGAYRPVELGRKMLPDYNPGLARGEMIKNCSNDFLIKYGFINEHGTAVNTLGGLRKAWSEYYDETIQSKIMITLTYNEVFGNTQHISPLMMIGKFRGLILEKYNFNDIKYIQLWTNKNNGYRHGGNSSIPDEHRLYLDDDNMSLHKYGLGDHSHIYVSHQLSTIPIELPEAPSPAPVPSVIHAELASSVRNDEITEMKDRISELERKLEHLENLVKPEEPRDRVGEVMTLNL